MRFRFRGLFFYFFLLLVVFPFGQGWAVPSAVEGYWQTQDADGIVEFRRCDDGLVCGRFVWLKEDSAENPSLDDKNRDPEKRSRPLCGMTFLGGFKDGGEGRYTDGWIYSPRHGHEYSANLTLKGSDTLVLRGYVFLPLLGGEQIWTRVVPPNQECFR